METQNPIIEHKKRKPKKKIRLTGKFRDVKISYREQGEDKINNHSSRSLGNEITCITIETDEDIHVEGLHW